MGAEPENTDRFLTVDEAADLVALSHWTIRLWLRKGRLTRYMIGSRVVVNLAELRELLKPTKAN